MSAIGRSSGEITKAIQRRFFPNAQLFGFTVPHFLLKLHSITQKHGQEKTLLNTTRDISSMTLQNYTIYACH